MSIKKLLAVITIIFVIFFTFALTVSAEDEIETGSGTMSSGVTYTVPAYTLRS